MSAHLDNRTLDWLLWQLADSAFPTGGFAHSGGLESAWQHGEIRTRADLLQFSRAALAQCSRASLPFAATAFDRSAAFPKIDRQYDAFTSNHVANRASRLQGRAFLNSARSAFDNLELESLHQEVQSEALPGHFAPVCGAIYRSLDLPRAAALRLFLFTQLRGWTSSAVRLGIIGPLEAQKTQASLSECSEELLSSAADLSLESAVQTAPILEILHASHDRLYSRLFQS